MSEFILPNLAFTTLHGEQHTIGIGENWEVFVDSELSERYMPPAAVMILGFANSLDTVVTRSVFYQTVLSGYDRVLANGRTTSVPEFDDDRSANKLGKRLSALTGTLISPLRTNIIQLHNGIQKRLLICRNPADEELVSEIIGRSILSENPDTNEKIKKLFFDSYMQKKATMLRRPGGVITKS